MLKAIIAATSLLLAACMPDENAVECTTSADCNLAAGGACDTFSATGNSWCSYGSSECPGGRVWGSESVGDGLAGTCVQVAPGPDAPPPPPDGGITPDANLDGTPAGCWAISWVKEQGSFSSPSNPLGLNDRLLISETAAAFRSRDYFEGELDHTGTLTSACFSVPAGNDYGPPSDIAREAYSLCLNDGILGGAIQWHKPSSPSGDIRYRLSGVPTDPPCE
jgi:hypothetical protein